MKCRRYLLVWARLAWPGQTLRLESPTQTERTQVRLLGAGPLAWKPAGQGLAIELPPLSALPCRHAWVFPITGLKSIEQTPGFH